MNIHSADRAPALHEALIAHLDRQREHVLAGIEGLGERALDRVVAPSGWTLRGMVTHLLYDVEIFWMGAVLGADPSAIARVCDGWAAPSIPGRQLRQEYRAAADVTPPEPSGCRTRGPKAIGRPRSLRKSHAPTCRILARPFVAILTRHSAIVTVAGRLVGSKTRKKEPREIPDAGLPRR